MGRSSLVTNGPFSPRTLRELAGQARVFHKKRRRWDVLAVGGRYDSTVAQYARCHIGCTTRARVC